MLAILISRQFCPSTFSSNWAVNLDEIINWFVRRMGIITVKYNNIGVETYPWFMETLKILGINSFNS